MVKPGAIDEHHALTEVVGRWWEDPTLTGLNRLPARASTRSHRSLDEARSGAAARWCDLDSDWWFRLLDSPLQAPAGWTMARTTRPVCTVVASPVPTSAGLDIGAVTESSSTSAGPRAPRRSG